MQRIESKLLQETGQEPSDDELAGKLGIDAGEVPNLRKIAQRAISLETPIGGMSSAVLADSLESSTAPDPFEAALGLMIKESLGRALNGLDRRQRKVIELRFGLAWEHPCSLEEIGRRLNVSRECIRQIESKALEKLKAAQEIQAVRRILGLQQMGGV
jgi:RNA polymerase primary sigma factor